MKLTHALTAVLIALFLVTTLFGLEKAGRSARSAATPHDLTDPSLPHKVLAGPGDVFAFWKQQGVRGNIVVHVGRDLHFTPVEKPDSEKGAPAYPIVVPAAALEYESALNAQNFLWLAMRSNMARQVISVLPHDSFREKVSLVQEAVQKGYLGILAMDDTTIVAHELGSRRVITDGYLPPIDEPVVLNVDASIFSFYEPAALYALLEKAGLRIMLMTCSLSEGNAAVKDQARTRLKEFAQLVATHRK